MRERLFLEMGADLDGETGIEGATRGVDPEYAGVPASGAGGGSGREQIDGSSE